MIGLLDHGPSPRSDEPPVPDSPALDASELAVATIRARTSVLSQVITVICLTVPPLGIVVAAAALWGVGFHLTDLILFLVFYVATGLGITVGYHRLFTHRSFEAHTAVRALLAVLGAMTLQGPLTQWVTDHRKHHARSDVEGDPHSPHLAGPGVLGVLRGLTHAHVGWMFSTKGMERGELYGRDIYSDRLIRGIDRFYLLWVVLSVGLPYGLGYLITGTSTGALEALVWAGLVRIFAFGHATFAVNSACHFFGKHRYAVGDHSSNNVVVALLTFGEGWHNNHHAFPRSARHGLGRLQLDVSWWVIRLLAACHLARSVSLPTTRQLVRVARAG